MGLEHCVVTSVCRDDLADGGAGVFAETISYTRLSGTLPLTMRHEPGCFTMIGERTNVTGSRRFRRPPVSHKKRCRRRPPAAAAGAAGRSII